MADGKFLVGKPSGGVTTVTVTDGASNTNLVLPESGNLVSVNTAVTDNAIARYDGTTGKLQNSGVIIDDGGNLGIGGSPYAKLSTLAANNGIAENVFMAGILGATNGFIVSKDSVANPNYKFLTTTQAIGLEIDSGGNVLLKSGTGALGYGIGAGGTVTQLTSKSATVTLNKPTGRITMSNAALPAGATVSFTIINTLIGVSDNVLVTIAGGFSQTLGYQVWCNVGYSGTIDINVKNIHSTTLSESVIIDFKIIKGATS